MTLLSVVRCLAGFFSFVIPEPISVVSSSTPRPLMSIPNETQEVLTLREIELILSSVALDWAPLRSTTACGGCGARFATPTLEPLYVRIHCRRCGKVFCARCSRRRARLPGHADGRPVVVCNNCYNVLNGSEEEFEDLTIVEDFDEDKGNWK